MPPPVARRRALATLALLPLAAAAASAGACARERGRGDDRYVVGFSQTESDSPWRVAETASLREEADRRGVELVVTDAQGQTAQQLADVESLVARRVNAILLAPREYEGLAPALRAARDAKIPVLLVDRLAAGVAGRDYLTFLGSDFVEQGRRAAEWLARATNGKASVVELSGTPGASVAADRAKGFREGIARYPGMSIVASLSGNFTRAEGELAMQGLARSLGTRFAAVYAHNDEMALGAIQALKGAGRAPGSDVIVVSIDGERAALEAILAGELGATVESNPRFGPLAFDMIDRLRKGDSVPRQVILTDRLFDRSNAQRFLADAY